jgi:pimeloyl-ACP methyl ester carboxylesterase
VLSTINGVPYYWRECGRGPLLVLLHGGAAHSGWYQWMLPRLAQRYRVVAPDLRGLGRSGHADRYSWDAYAEDVEALVGRLIGDDEPYYLAGHCSGGYIGMLMSARGVRPPAALVGIEVRPKMPPEEDADMWARASRPPGRYRNLAALERTWRIYAQRHGIPAERGLLLGREACRQEQDGSWVSLADPRTLAQEPFETYALAARVQCPTLLIRGEQSHMLSRIQFLLVAGELRFGAFEEIPGVGHNLMVEDPDATCALIEHFLERTLERTAARGTLPAAASSQADSPPNRPS